MTKIIVIEGIDASGKKTQANLLLKRLREYNYITDMFSFPNYDSPTGKIIKGPFLGNESISKSYFNDGVVNTDSLVSSLYFTADRVYNLPILKDLLYNNDIVILDRYVESNMAYQGSKINNKEDRFKLYKKLETLEYDISELPIPDIKILLHVPYNYSCQLNDKRNESKDEHENNISYLKNVELTYFEIAQLYNYHIIECVKDNSLRSIEDINNELYNYVISVIN